MEQAEEFQANPEFSSESTAKDRFPLGTKHRMLDTRVGNGAKRHGLVLRALAEEAFDYHISGLTHLKIAEKMGISVPSVSRYVKRELERRAKDLEASRETMKADQLARIERLAVESMALAAKPGTGALTAHSKALEMRAKILGLDAPTKIEHSVTHLIESLNVLPEERPQKLVSEQKIAIDGRIDTYEDPVPRET